MADSDLLFIDLYCACAAVVSSEFLTFDVFSDKMISDFRNTLMSEKNATVGDQEIINTVECHMFCFEKNDFGKSSFFSLKITVFLGQTTEILANFTDMQ